MYVPVVTLSKENDIKLLEQLKTGFKRTIKWNKYRLQTFVQSNNNKLNYLIDPTFTKVNRLFVLSFERTEENKVKKDHRDFFFTLLSAKRWNKRLQCLNWWKRFLWFASKNEEEAYDKIIEISKNNDYTIGNLLDFVYFKENYKLIAIDLSNQTKLKKTQQIGKLEGQNHGATMFFIIKKIRRNYFWVFAKFYKHLIKMETQKVLNLSNSSENEYSKFATKK